MSTVAFSSKENRSANLLDTASVDLLPIEQGQSGFARAVQPVERACQVMAARRKVSCSGICRDYSASTSSTWFFRVSRDGYSKQLRIRIKCNLNGAASDDDFITVKAVTDEDAVGVSAIVTNDPAVSVDVDTARDVVLVIDYGDGTSASLGYDNVTITFTRSALGTVHVYAINFQPLGMDSIEVP